MKNIRTGSVYMHDGQKFSPKLVYAVPDAVADGLVGLGIAAYAKEAADLSFENLAWDPKTRRVNDVAPDALISQNEA